MTSNPYTYIDVYIQKVIPLNLLDMLDCLCISQLKQISVFRKHIPPARGFRGYQNIHLLMIIPVLQHPAGLSGHPVMVSALTPPLTCRCYLRIFCVNAQINTDPGNVGDAKSALCITTTIRFLSAWKSACTEGCWGRSLWCFSRSHKWSV